MAHFKAAAVRLQAMSLPSVYDKYRDNSETDKAVFEELAGQTIVVPGSREEIEIPYSEWHKIPGLMQAYERNPEAFNRPPVFDEKRVYNVFPESTEEPLNVEEARILRKLLRQNFVTQTHTLKDLRKMLEDFAAGELHYEEEDLEPPKREREEEGVSESKDDVSFGDRETPDTMDILEVANEMDARHARRLLLGSSKPFMPKETFNEFDE